jgi:hypothetical protein
LVEKVPYIHRSRLEDFVTLLLRKAFDHLEPDELTMDTDAGRRPIAAFEAHGSISLQQALETGYLKELTLVRREFVDLNLQDEVPHTIQDDYRSRLRFKPELTLLQKLSAVWQGGTRLTQESFDELRITYRIDGTKSDNTIVIEREEELDPNNSLLFAKNELVRFDQEKRQCDERLHLELLSKIYGLLNMQLSWSHERDPHASDNKVATSGRESLDSPEILVDQASAEVGI